MLDLIVRGGGVVDGTGAAPRTADVAIKDGRIVDVGRVSAPAREVIDADGALVTPGFIDLHTHYDGQFLWDDQMDPSFSHGVTTAIAGNCGVGFAPVAQHRRELLELMEGVEDIPGIVLDEGLDWSWRSFPEYLDKLAGRRYAMDVATHITHAPLRVFVMGERALRHEAATGEDIAAMCELVREAMAAGAVGFSNGQHTGHVSSRGLKVPGTFAQDEELLAIAKAMGEGGRGVVQHIPDIGNATDPEGSSDENRLRAHRLMESMARASGRPVTYTLVQRNFDPEGMQMMLGESDRAWGEGLRLYPQVSPRGIGAIYMLDGYHIFMRKNAYREIAHLPRRERAMAMRDPARRAAILRQENVDGEYAQNPAVMRMLNAQPAYLPGAFVPTSPLDCEPGPEWRVAVLAQAAGKTVEEFVYDLYAAGDGDNYVVVYPGNYALGNLDHVAALFDKPNAVMGLGDGGAHMRVMCDASMPTFVVAFMTRDRTRGERLPLEQVVRKLSKDAADLYDLDDRGTLEVGKRADLNVIDYDRLNLKAPSMVYDLPSGAGRLLQGSQGYLATLVAGVATRRNDADTGARPGRLIRTR